MSNLRHSQIKKAPVVTGAGEGPVAHTRRIKHQRLLSWHEQVYTSAYREQLCFREV